MCPFRGIRFTSRYSIIISYIHVAIEYILYSGKFLQVQTFAKMPPEAPEEIFAVLIFPTSAA